MQRVIPRRRRKTTIERMRPMDLGKSYVGDRVERLDCFRNDAGEIVLTLGVAAGTFTITVPNDDENMLATWACKLTWLVTLDQDEPRTPRVPRPLRDRIVRK